jgi:predicted dehydrogenase
VDFSYRTLAGASRIRDLIRGGQLGRLYAIDLVFHNAYGPDKPWFYDPRLSGGGCVIDLGVHLADLLLWMLDYPEVMALSSRLMAAGRPLTDPSRQIEDYAIAQIDLAGGVTARLACSWRISAGCDAVIAAEFYGTAGGAALRNVGGSFVDFTAERFRGTSRELLAAPPDPWGGRAASEWARRLAVDPGFDPAAERYLDVACLIDAIYGR